MSQRIKVTLVRSVIGRPKKHRDTLRGLGLTKLNKTVSLEDTPQVRGMVRKVIHLVKAEQVPSESADAGDRERK